MGDFIAFANLTRHRRNSVAKKIRAKDSSLKKLRDTSVPLAAVAHSVVEAALGAECANESLEEALAPINLFAVRAELLRRLQSSGGRPALSGASRRVKIPLGNAEWTKLEELASMIAGYEGDPKSSPIAPSAGQIASVLLGLSVQSVISQVNKSSKPALSPLARELAARSTMKSSQR